MASVVLLEPGALPAVHREAASSEPLARSVFDIYLADGALTYVKEPCAQADTEDRFFLHVVPQSADDLPEVGGSTGSTAWTLISF